MIKNIKVFLWLTPFIIVGGTLSTLIVSCNNNNEKYKSKPTDVAPTYDDILSMESSLSSITSHLDISDSFNHSIEEIAQNSSLSIEERYKSILEYSYSYDIELVDHVGLNNKVNEIGNTQRENILNSDEYSSLSNNQKKEVLEKTELLFEKYIDTVLNESILMDDVNTNSISFIEESNLPLEQKEIIFKELILNNFLDINTISISQNAHDFEWVFTNKNIEQYVNTNYSIEVTEFLNDILILNEDSDFNSKIIEGYELYSKIANLNYADGSFELALSLDNDVQEDSWTTYFLKPSIEMQRIKMTSWFNELNFNVNNDFSYDVLAGNDEEISGYNPDIYVDRISIGSNYSFTKNNINEFYKNSNIHNHQVYLRGWTISFDICKNDLGLYGQHTLKSLIENEYITNAKINLDANSACGGGIGSEILGWGLKDDYSWNTTLNITNDEYTEWLGTWDGGYKNAKTFMIKDLSSSTIVDFGQFGNTEATLTANWNFRCTDIGFSDINDDKHAEWAGNGNRYVSPKLNSWSSLKINDLHSYNQTPFYYQRNWTVETNPSSIYTEVNIPGSIIPLSDINTFLLFDNEPYDQQKLSDEYVLSIKLRNIHEYRNADLKGQIDFDIIVSSIYDDTISVVFSNYKEDFKKEVTKGMIVGIVKEFMKEFEVINLDTSVLKEYASSIIAYIVIEALVQATEIAMMVYDAIKIIPLLFIPFGLGWPFAVLLMIEIALICKDLYDVITNTIELNCKKDEINKTANDIDNIKAELNGKDEDAMENIIDNLELEAQIIGLQAIWDYIYDIIEAFTVDFITKLIFSYVMINVTKIVSEILKKKIIEKITLRNVQLINGWWYALIIIIEGGITFAFLVYWEIISSKIKNMCIKLTNVIMEIKTFQEWREYFE